MYESMLRILIGWGRIGAWGNFGQYTVSSISSLLNFIGRKRTEQLQVWKCDIDICINVKKFGWLG